MTTIAILQSWESDNCIESNKIKKKNNVEIAIISFLILVSHMGGLKLQQQDILRK